MIERMETDGVTLAEPVDTAIRCGYEEKLNELGTATLELAAGDPLCGEMEVPVSWVRLTDGETPAGLYRANLWWLGLPDLTKFASADYFPLIPWLFLFWAGLFAARLVRPALAAPPAALRPLCRVGRHTLAVYRLHQPILYGALWVVFHVKA